MVAAEEQRQAELEPGGERGRVAGQGLLEDRAGLGEPPGLAERGPAGDQVGLGLGRRAQARASAAASASTRDQAASSSARPA